MKRQDSLEWFLIKKFIEILILVGVIEYVITFLLNQFILPPLLAYFFPQYEKNIATVGSGIIFFVFSVLLILILSAFFSIFPSPLHEMMISVLEKIQKGLGYVVFPLSSSTFVAELSRTKAVMLFLVFFVLALFVLAPYIVGAVYFAKIVIREFKEIQRQREEEQKEFDRKRNLMLSDIAHDLRTPMTTVSGYAKALSDGMVESPEKKKEYLQAIQSKTIRMNNLINLLFEYVKLDSDGFSLDLKTVDICELLRENAALIYSDMEDKGMEFEIDIPETKVDVTADVIQLSRVITNLLNNALKHNAQGTKIALFLKCEGHNIYIVVADNGEAIQKEFSEHLFEPFTKGDASRKGGSGSGLGLSIAQKVVKMHGWQIHFLQQPQMKKWQKMDEFTKAFVICAVRDKTEDIYGIRA